MTSVDLFLATGAGQLAVAKGGRGSSGRVDARGVDRIYDVI